jgi:hypothetical protein
MAMVVGVGAVMLLLMATMAASSVSGLLKSSHDEDWNASIAAAYAGVSDYQSRLAADSSYVQYGNPLSTFGASATRAIALPPVTNPAFGLDSAAVDTGTAVSTGTAVNTGTAAIGSTWATVAGSPAAQYRYEVDNSSYSQTGVVRLRVTGRVGSSVRSIVADLNQKGFIDYLYFTNFEVRDPDLLGTATSNVCSTSYHAWELTTPRPTSCLIQFLQTDEINGPLHSNDTIVICGGQFDGAVTTSNPTAINGLLYSNSACSPLKTPVFVLTPLAGVTYAKQMVMPSPSSLVLQQRTDLPLTVDRPGCLYTGPTSITFSGAFMTVRSPWTVKTQVAGDSNISGTTPSMCGTPGDPSKSQAQNVNTLAGAAGVTIPVLDHNMAYVQAVPASATDPNYWGGVYPNLLSQAAYCTGATPGTSGNGIGYPVAAEKSPDQTAGGYPYDCLAGDVFTSGGFDASMTVASARYIYVTGDLVRQDTQKDILGLIGTKSIFVFNPVNSSGAAILTDAGRQIDAAMLSVSHSFQVENYAIGGGRGSLTVNGSIAQNYRGTVSKTVSGVYNGYSKNYVYDPRLRSIAPPKFLSPVSTTFAVNALVEVKSAFTLSGAAVQ